MNKKYSKKKHKKYSKKKKCSKYSKKKHNKKLNSQIKQYNSQTK